MARHLFILTGSSRGLGAAMLEQLMVPGHTLLGISRTNPPGQRTVAEARGARLEHWDADLTEPVGIAARLQAWLEGFDADEVASATLVNNAALLTRIGPLDRGDDGALSASLRASLEAPLLLSAAFLRATRSWPAPRRVLNISSGLGRRAMAGTAAYCAAKAALDHASRAMALDEAAQPHGARSVALAPGVIDTDMQVELRGADADGFPEQSVFVGLKEGGQLTSAAAAAARVLAYLERADFGANPVADVRDA